MPPAGMRQFTSTDRNKVVVITFDSNKRKKGMPAWNATILIRYPDGQVIISKARAMYDEEHIIAEVINYERGKCGHDLVEAVFLPAWTDAPLNRLGI